MKKFFIYFFAFIFICFILPALLTRREVSSSAVLQEEVSNNIEQKEESIYKGNIIKAGTSSPYSLYNESIASFTTGDLYDHHDAEGFINLFGLSCKVRAMKLKEAEEL